MANEFTQRTRRRISLDKENGWLLGVCAGLANYLRTKNVAKAPQSIPRLSAATLNHLRRRFYRFLTSSCNMSYRQEHT